MPSCRPTGAGGWSEFQDILINRLFGLHEEHRRLDTRLRDFVMPCGLFLVIDKANGGDITAQELVKRFHLLHQESGVVIDFYFLGWEWRKSNDRSQGIRFNLDAFQKCRKALKSAGIKSFGGNAELILVDAHHKMTKSRAKGLYEIELTLDFRNSIHVNLSSRRDAKNIPPLGDFLQSIIQAAEEVQASASLGKRGVVFAISDKLGIAIAKRSILEFIYEKLGKIIGAEKLDAVAARNIGPEVKVFDLAFDALAPAVERNR